MNIGMKIFVSLLLLFNGAAALFGGYSLMTKPDGTGIRLPLNILQNAPFTDFFVPGLILFVANGMFSFVALAALIFRYKRYPLLVAAQGVILFGWILVQVIMLQVYFYLQLVMGIAGLLLLILGLYLQKKQAETTYN